MPPVPFRLLFHLLIIFICVRQKKQTKQTKQTPGLVTPGVIASGGRALLVGDPAALDRLQHRLVLCSAPGGRELRPAAGLGSETKAGAGGRKVKARTARLLKEDKRQT